MSLFIYSARPSNGARALASLDGFRRIRGANSQFRAGNDKVVINWGNTQLPQHIRGSNILNMPAAIQIASNKLSFFSEMRNKELSNDIPEWTTDRAEAIAWVRGGHKAVCRTILSGSGGAGIVIATDDESVLDAPLYVKYMSKNEEYRVHVFKGTVIDQQRKARNRDVENPNWEIRNHENGFIYMREGVVVPEQCLEAARKAVGACGLDFGAVDLIWSNARWRGWVLEVNTAPGLEGRTVESYAEAFRGYANGNA